MNFYSGWSITICIYVHLPYFSQINLPLHCSAQRDAESNDQLCFTHLLDPSTIMPFPRLLRLVDDLFCFCLLLSWFICKDRLCIMCLDYWRVTNIAKGKFVFSFVCSRSEVFYTVSYPSRASRLTSKPHVSSWCYLASTTSSNSWRFWSCGCGQTTCPTCPTCCSSRYTTI